MSESRRSFCVTGVTLSGNMGGSAMLFATLQQLRQRYPGSAYRLLSIYPARDRQLNTQPDLEIVAAAPLRLLAILTPLAVLALLLPFLRGVLARCSPFFRAVADSDAVIDLSGIAFVDGRGLPLLWYNLSCVLPGLAYRKPVFKLSQALGPFRRRLNRLAASFALRRCASVVARGAASLEHLRGLGLRSAVMLPDVSFAMEVPDAVRAEAARRYAALGDAPEWIVVSPSEVVNRLCTARGIDFLGEMERFVRLLLQGTQAGVLILPHSLGTGGSKNNDIELCRALAARLEDTSRRVALLVAEEDPVLLRALIGRGACFVGCRFHAVAAALSMSVPTVILGWSHKYREMADAFSREIPALDYSACKADSLMAHFEPVWRDRENIRRQLELAGAAVREQARGNYDLVAATMVEGHASK